MLQGGVLVLGGFIGGGQFVVQGGAGFFIERGQLEGLFIPADGRFGDALVEEALGEPGIGLHDQLERVAAVDGLADFLEFSDGLVEQSHFAEGDAEVVVGFGILFGDRVLFFEFVADLAEHVGQVDAGGAVGAGTMAGPQAGAKHRRRGRGFGGRGGNGRRRRGRNRGLRGSDRARSSASSHVQFVRRDGGSGLRRRRDGSKLGRGDRGFLEEAVAERILQVRDELAEHAALGGRVRLFLFFGNGELGPAMNSRWPTRAGSVSAWAGTSGSCSISWATVAGRKLSPSEESSSATIFFSGLAGSGSSWGAEGASGSTVKAGSGAAREASATANSDWPDSSTGSISTASGSAGAEAEAAWISA